MAKPPRLCGRCGRVHLLNVLCPQRLADQRARKARHDANRPSARERGYDSRWQKERTVFLHLHPLCRRCGNPATVVDHVIPHKGDDRAFWDRSNWQALCTQCHSSHKQRTERRAMHDA